MTTETWVGITGTPSGSISYPRHDETYSTQIRRNELAHLRDRVKLLDGDIVDMHRESQMDDIEARTHRKAKTSVSGLLDELATNRGMAWTDIARLARVSVGAIRKWRAGQPASPENRQSLALLAAFLDLLDESAVADPAQWLEMPLKPGYTATVLDLYDPKLLTHLLDFASHRIDADKLLDRLKPNWRSQFRSDYEVVEAADGVMSIRARKP